MSRSPRVLEVAVRFYLVAFFLFFPVSGALRGGALPKLMVASAIGISVWDMVSRWARPRLGAGELLLMAYGIWYMISAGVSPYPMLAKTSVVTVLGWPIVLLGLAQMLCNRGRVLSAVTGYMVGCAAAGAWGITNMLMGLVPTVQVPGQDVNDLGFYTATGCVMAIGAWAVRGNPRWLRVVAAVCTVILVVAVFGSLSRGSVGGLILGCLVIAAYSRDGRRRIGQGVVAGLALAVLSSPVWLPGFQQSLKMKSHVAGENVSSRLDAWGLGANLGAEHPLAGVGPTSITPWIMRQDHTPPGAFVVAVAHNTFIEALYGTGVVGLAILAAGVVATFRCASSVGRGTAGELVVGRRTGTPVLGALAAGLVCSLFTTQLFNATMWVLLGLGLAGSARPVHWRSALLGGLGGSRRIGRVRVPARVAALARR